MQTLRRIPSNSKMINPRTLPPPLCKAWSEVGIPVVTATVDLHHQHEGLQHSHDVTTDIRQ